MVLGDFQERRGKACRSKERRYIAALFMTCNGKACRSKERRYTSE
jgi:hypothetical protein